MNNMNTPGFTAAGSLYTTNGHYRGASVGFNSSVLIVPAVCSQDYCGPCINGWQSCCVEGGYPHRVRCEAPPPPPPTCGPCVGVRQCSDGTQKSCSV